MKRDTHGMLHVESYYDLIGWQVINAFHSVGNQTNEIMLIIERAERRVGDHTLVTRKTVFCPMRYMPTLVIQYELKRRE